MTALAMGMRQARPPVCTSQGHTSRVSRLIAHDRPGMPGKPRDRQARRPPPCATPSGPPKGTAGR
jgi:hypothetical protein